MSEQGDDGGQQDDNQSDESWSVEADADDDLMSYDDRGSKDDRESR